MGKPTYPQLEARVRQLEMETAEKSAVENELVHRIKFEKMVNQVTMRLLEAEPTHLDSAIDETLSLTGQFTRADRSYIFLFADNNSEMSNTHEWCAPGIAPQIDKLKKLSANRFSWWLKKLRHFKYIHIPSVAALPPEANNEKNILKDQNIQSLLAVALYAQNELNGFIGFDAVRHQADWTEADITLLRTVSNILSLAFDRKYSQESLAAKEIELESIFRAAPTGIGVTRNRIILQVNKRLCEMLGYAPVELIGNSAGMLYPSTKEFEWVGKEKYEQIRRKGTGTVETRWVRKNGDIIHVVLSSTPIKPGDPDTRITFTALDITERKHSENLLKESEERFRELAELLPGIIFEMDTSGKLTFANRAAFEHFRYSQEDMEKGLNGFDMIHPQDQPQIIEAVNRVMKGERIQLNECTAVRSDGTTFPAIIHSSAIIRNGIPVGLRGFIVDITENKRLETQLLHAQKMESIGTLAGGIAHDFNNLLMGIQGRVSLIRLESDGPRIHHEHLAGIEDCVKSATNLTRQLLGFARGGKYEVKPTNLNDLVQKQTQMFARTRKEITIHEKYTPDIWVTDIDRGQIEQVILNLFVNAWQAMPGGGDLYIQTENVNMEPIQANRNRVPPGRYVSISVTDTGVGMDQATKRRIFEPFFTTKSMGRGTGLGLASAYGIVKNHGGIIDVQSEKGKGATFVIYLPASTKKLEKNDAKPRELVKGSGTVLLVDDEMMILNVGEKLLKKLGYTVISARSGREAVDIYTKKWDEISLVILDMIMPDMPGGDTFDRLKSVNGGVKVLLSSGYSINGQASEILRRGCNGFIQKPFGLNELSAKIREVMESAES